MYQAQLPGGFEGQTGIVGSHGARAGCSPQTKLPTEAGAEDQDKAGRAGSQPEATASSQQVRSELKHCIRRRIFSKYFYTSHIN